MLMENMYQILAYGIVLSFIVGIIINIINQALKY